MKSELANDIIPYSLSVDAACSGNPGIMEYQGVKTYNQEVLFRKGPYPNCTNNIGEFLALVHAISLLKREGLHDVPIYSDSVTAIAWVKKKKANTKLPLSQANIEVVELITRAEKWLRENVYTNPIIKWNTAKWGEIPADFGRKK